MTLMQTCGDLSERIQAVGKIKKSAEEAKSLETRLKELKELKGELDEACGLSGVLLSHGIAVDVGTKESGPALRALEKILDRFATKPEAASLTKGRDWDKMTDGCQAVKDEIEASTLKAWKDHVASLYKGQSPKALETGLAKTKANIAALVEYEALYKELESAKAYVPEDPADIVTAQKTAGKLKKVAAKFDFDVPNNVKAFLAAIARGGAPLELLTTDVLAWLEENRTQQNYQIVGRG